MQVCRESIIFARVWSDVSTSSLGFHGSWRRTILPPSGCKNVLLNINGLCLDNALGFCTVKLRHNYVDLHRKKHLKSTNTIIISKLNINVLCKVHNLPCSFF